MVIKKYNDNKAGDNGTGESLVRAWFRKLDFAGQRQLAGRCPQVLVCCVLFLCACSASAEVKHRFSINASPLAKALVQFVSQSGAGVVVADDVDTSLEVKPVDAELEVSQALHKMLSGLALTAERTEEGYYVIRRFQPAPKPVDILPRMEELVVTGTYIKGGLGRSLNPLTVIDRAELQATGMPSTIDLIATLPAVSGTENQSNQFHNVNAAGTANINLRGLGVSRTLVLLNGKRLASSALPHNDGQAYVDINTIPVMALEQVDILKDGAGATYGSDAVAGVVNFITRDDFDGLELRGSGKYIDEGDGDWDMGLLAGSERGAGHWFGVVSYSRRNELQNVSREAVVQPKVDIPALQRIVYSVSSVGNPGAFVPIDTITAADGVTDADVALAAMGRDNYVRDPQCTNVGGHIIEGGRCGFNYVVFDNLVEEEERWQAFSAWQVPLRSGFLGDSAEFYSELNYTYLELTEWKTSPSFPPVKEADVVQYLPADHPGLIDFVADNPGILENDGDVADFSGGAIFVGRPVGVGGSSASGYRSQETLRFLAGIRGETGLQYDLSLAYASNRAKSRTVDTLIDRWQAAMLGFGGPDCNGSQAGQNGCQFYNPFASSIPDSPGYDPALTNSAELLTWMREELVQENTSELSVADALFSGSFRYREGRSLNYAFGLQYRQERLKIRFNDFGDVALNPGDITVPGELPGVFVFFRGGREDDVSQNVAALFGELAIPLRKALLVQLALRYENYGGAVGQSLDPKVAMRWDVSPELTLRASVSTTFRAPSLNQTSLDTTSLELIGAAFAFKAVDRIGNPELEPEQAVSANLGVIWEPSDQWQINLDYWRFDFSDVIVQESANAIVNTVLADPSSSRASQVIFDGSGNISRILSNYINGPDILVDGIDFSGRYAATGFDGVVTLGWDLAYLHRYDVGRNDLLDAFSADDRLNTGTFVKSLPKWQGNLYLNFSRDLVNTRLVLNAISSYKDDGLDILEQTSLAEFVTDAKVDAFYSVDIHFSIALSPEKTSVSLSVLNLADRDPPAVRADMRFDTTLHNAFGRMVKLNLRHEF